MKNKKERKIQKKQEKERKKEIKREIKAEIEREKLYEKNNKSAFEGAKNKKSRTSSRDNIPKSRHSAQNRHSYKNISTKIILSYLRRSLFEFFLFFAGYLLFVSLNGLEVTERQIFGYNIVWDFYNILSLPTMLFLLCGLIIILGFNFIISAFSTLRAFNKTYRSLNSFLDDSQRIMNFAKSFSDVEIKMKDIKMDIMEIRHLAEQSENQKNDLIMYLAHDLKTPLTSIIGYLTLLEESPDLTKEQRAKFTGITLDKAYRLEELITEFFDIAKFNIKTIELQKNKIDLGMMLTQIADEFYSMLLDKNLEISLDLKESIIMYADYDKLARVFDNLLKNAVKYSYEGSVILIGARIRNGKVIIKFRNRCDMIPEETLNKLFDKFYRAGSARSSSTGGSGLGLAIAKQLIELHSGTITAKSTEDYTDFTVSLPFFNAKHQNQNEDFLD